MTHIPWGSEVVWGVGESLHEEVLLEVRFEGEKKSYPAWEWD